MKPVSSMTTEEIALLDRAILLKEEIARIEKLIMETPMPKLGAHSVEDVDELYQARLEWRWEQDDREFAIEQLKSEKESIDARLQ